MRSSNSQSRFPAIMVFDFFRKHLKESVKEKFNQSNIDLAVIPGGLTNGLEDDAIYEFLREIENERKEEELEIVDMDNNDDSE
ncbi:unnamed protein product [Rhizophagus irregularis]|nr:unnamed protein product [Rhizophagus irregularis]